MRQGSENRLRRGVKRFKRHWQRLLAWDPLWIALLVVVGAWVLMPGGGISLGEVEVGEIAVRDHVAPRDLLVLDEEATSEKRQRARERVLTVYDFDGAAAERLTAEIDGLFERARRLRSEDGDEREDGERQGDGEGTMALEEERLEELSEESSLQVTPQQLRALEATGFSRTLQSRLSELAGRLLERGVIAGKTLLLENAATGVQVRDLETGREIRRLDLYDYRDYPDEVEEAIAAEVQGWETVPAAARDDLVDFLRANITPNLHLNQSETLRRQEQAAAAVESVYNRVRKGQVIVRKGDEIGPQTARGIEAYRGDRGILGRTLSLLGTALFLGLVALVLWLAVHREKVTQNRRGTVMGEVLLLTLVSVLGAKVCHLVVVGLASSIEASPFDDVGSYYYAIPFAALGLVTVLIYGRRLALFLVLVFSVVAGLVTQEPSWSLAAYSMAGSLAAIFAVDQYTFKSRAVMVRAGAAVSAVNVVAVLMLEAIAVAGVGGTSLLFSLLCAVVGGFLAAGVASFLVPLLEAAFSVTTTIKLVELANTNLPLLRDLAFEAPGTFQHSLMVANLAKEGCEAIGADSTLAYTGALYHDIGKIFRPDYFSENQPFRKNPHDKLLPSMSALILISHVKDGLELARQNDLPESILDAIAEHHGTRRITFFYERAKELQDPEVGEVSEEKFRYPGPKPHNKVMGVLMLADGVEAASRSLDDPSPARIRSVVETITEDCLQDGQLDETDLTLGDLKSVVEAFQRVLTHIGHRRPDYPGFDFTGRDRKRPPAEAPRGEDQQAAIAAVKGGGS